MLLDFIFHKRECTHDKVPVDVDEAYCPDCGALIKNKWFLVRCSCCNIKRQAHTHYDDIIPDTKYCPNCGSTDFYIEELENINFLNVHYAVFKKVIVPQNSFTTRQVWVEKEENFIEEKKLLGVNQQ